MATRTDIEHHEVLIELASPFGRSLYRTLTRTGWVTATLSGIVLLIISMIYLMYPPENPANNPRWEELRQKALADPQNEAVVSEFRSLDVALRRRYFSATRLLNSGAILAVGGGILAACCWGIASLLRQRLLVPVSAGSFEELEERERQEASRAVVVGSLMFAVIIGGLAILFRPPVNWREAISGRVASTAETGETAPSSALARLPETGPPLSQAGASTQPPFEPGATRIDEGKAASGADSGRSPPEAQAAEGASPGGGNLLPPRLGPAVNRKRPSDEVLENFWQEYCRQWPRFRGPEGAGISRTGAAAIQWNAVSGDGVLWKAAVPLPGNSSPVIWEDRIFLTGADSEKLAVFCYDINTGSLLWEREIRSGAEPPLDPKKVAKETGFASPTPATDGRRVYVMFAPGDVAALDFRGQILWARNLGVPDNIYGHAASLECFVDTVFIQYDQGNRPQQGKSRLYALAADSGQSIFEIPRPVQNSWASPILVRWQDRWQLITASTPWVISYDPFTGEELWRFSGIEGDQGPSPVFLKGVVHAGNEYSYWFAIRADGTGDVTNTHLLWKAEEHLPDLCSPLAVDEFVFLLASWGILSCYDAATGEKLWELELEGSFISSPGWAEGYVYVIGEQYKPGADDAESAQAICWVIRPSREGGEIVAENPIGERCTASPAFVHGKLLIRGEKSLICIAPP